MASWEHLLGLSIRQPNPLPVKDDACNKFPASVMPLYNEDPTRGAVAALVQLADCGSMPFGFLPQAQAHPHMLSSMGLVDNAALLNQAARRPNIASLLQHDLSTYIVSARQAEFAQRQHEALHCNDEAVHVVLPRRKAGELDAPERDAVVVTPEVLESLFHLPLAEASHRLGLSATTIKKLCRKLGIDKWPYKSPYRTPRVYNSNQDTRNMSATSCVLSTVSSRKMSTGSSTSASTPCGKKKRIQSKIEAEREDSPAHSVRSSIGSPPSSSSTSPVEQTESASRMSISALLSDTDAEQERESKTHLHDPSVPGVAWGLMDNKRQRISTS